MTMHSDTTPSPWAAPAAYLYALDLDGPALAWEYLRRHPACRASPPDTDRRLHRAPLQHRWPASRGAAHRSERPWKLQESKRAGFRGGHVVGMGERCARLCMSRNSRPVLRGLVKSSYL